MATTKTKYSDVYKDDKGRFFYQVFLGRVQIAKNTLRKEERMA